jgi:putative ABC transport system permease protein
VFVALQPSDIPGLRDVSLDGRMVSFALAATALSAVIAGLAPTLALTRRTRITRTDTSRQTPGDDRRIQRTLVTVQVALAIVLLVGAGVLTRSFVHLLRVDPGFLTDRVLALQVFTYGERYRTPQQRAGFFDQALERLRRLPDVETAGLVSAMPFADANINIESPLTIEGRAPHAAGEEASTFVTVASAEYFRAMAIPVLDGRAFNGDDRLGARLVCLVSEGLARRHWPGGRPVGAIVTVRFNGAPIRAEIVGVVGHVRHDGLDRSPRLELFLPYTQLPFGSMTFVVKTRTDPAAVASSIRREIWSVDPTLPFYDVAAAEQLVGRSVSPRRFALTLVSGFAALAFAVCAMGIYGMVTFAMARRTREIGVRLTLGAQPGDIHRMIVGETSRLALVGIATGALSSLAVTMRFRSMLFGIGPVDPPTLAAAAVVVLMVASLAAWLPAWRATRADPLVALRSD